MPSSPALSPSPKFHRRPQAQVRAISIKQKLNSPTTSPVRKNSPTECNDEQIDPSTTRPIRGAYVNIQSEEGKRKKIIERYRTDCTDSTDINCSKNLIMIKPINDPNHCTSPLPTTLSILHKNSNHNNITNASKKHEFYPQSMFFSGNTPKLGHKKLFPVVNLNLQTFNDYADITQDNSDKEIDNNDIQLNSERKIKRSESYRMANSPIMFIKKFSNAYSNDKTDNNKISRTASEELRDDLFKERINYPETVASPPSNLSPGRWRHEATDIEPARVLKYSGNDTEIW